MKFTEALDEYLRTKRIVDELRESFTGGYYFSDIYHHECSALQKAEDVLNSFFTPKEPQE
jgi:hypothetical protein